ncbi:helix-turn-helix domain-containing protein [Affinibrenneria salicis]|uniref:Helix-turn-helix domain-containing protein n=1 Tax=Affinibrenneria salicis TaxID=2590031 RepID=A0A5J5FW63_9GAMM|nr:XRE family transcriptional regulator [Affinibrenneria salicis]KAA8998058.1 helix-turn-helix domain-containing protein [Affinibrenneria salicis]
MSIDDIIAEQINQLRREKNLSIEQLARLSGVSKAMISKIERRESSPSATLLGRLAAGLGVPVTQLLTGPVEPAQRLRQRHEQETWRDPELGYIRRQVTEREADSGLEMVEISLPGQTRISYPRWSNNVYQQRLWLIEGSLQLDYGDEHFTLSPGDCLNFDVNQPVTFSNRTDDVCRYLLVITGA